MNENEIISMYHYFFLFLAFLVSLLAIGATTKVWIFKNVSAAHQHALVGTFLIGAAGAVVTNYKSLPELEIKRAEHYLFSLDYYDNFSSLHYSSVSHDLYYECFINKNDENNIKDRCDDLQENIQTLAESLSTRGIGEMFLSLTPKADLYKGLVTYSFPDDQTPISMTLDGVKVDSNNIEMNFLQPARFKIKLTPAVDITKDKDIYRKKISQRPAFSFTINFKKIDGGEIFKGILYHPSTTADCDIFDREKLIDEKNSGLISSFEMLYPPKKHLLNIPSNNKPQCYVPLAVASIAPTF